MARPRPTPPTALRRGRAGTCRTRVPSPGGSPGPSSSTETDDLAAVGDRAEMHRRPDGGVYLAAFSSRFDEHLLHQPRVDTNKRQAVGNVDRDRMPASVLAQARERRSDHLLERLPFQVQARSARPRGASCPARWPRAGSFPSIAHRCSRAPRSAPPAVPALTRLTTPRRSPRAACAGRARSRRAGRCAALGLGVDAARSAPARRAARARARARSGGEGLEQVELLGQQNAARVGGQHAEHAEHRLGSRERQIQRFGGGQGVGAEAGRLAVVLTTHCATARSAPRSELGMDAARIAAACRSRPAAAPPPGCRTPRHVPHRARAMLDCPRGRELAAHRVEQRGAPLAVAGDRSPARTLAVRLAMMSATTSITRTSAGTGCR